MANLINQSDTLNQGREKLNAAILDAEKSLTESSKANNIASQASTKAEQAVAHADSIQEQFNQVVIEGDSSVEAAQARVDETGASHSTLKARLDTGFAGVSQQLAETTPQGIAANKNRFIVNLENVQITQWDRTIKDMDKNGVIYAIYNSYSIQKSTDNGKNFTLLHTFPSTNKIADIKCLDNGELAVGFSTDAVSNPAKVMVSSAGQSAWTTSLTFATVDPTIHTGWSMEANGSNVLVSEYSEGTKKGNKLYYSNNFGATFRVIFDVSTVSAAARHLHGSVYDEYWNRIWVMWGDGGKYSPDNKEIGLAYSDDFGGTWDFVDIPRQLLVGYAFEDRVIFVADQAPNGIYAFERGRKEDKPFLTLVYKHDDVQVISYITDRLYKRDKVSPLIIPWSAHSSVENVRMLLATYDGVNFQKLWEDTVKHTAWSPFFAVAPTNDNKILGSMFGDGRTNPSFLPSKLEADFVVEYKLAQSNPIEKTERMDFINARDLGLKGWGFDEAPELMNAINYCSKNGKTLLIPKDMTISVLTQVRLYNLTNVRIKCEGSIKFLSASSTTILNALKFINCRNINIEEVNFQGNAANNSGLRIDQTYLFFDGCTNVNIGRVTYKDVSGVAIKIVGSSEVVIDSVECSGQGYATEGIHIKNSRNVRVKNTKSDGLLQNINDIYFINIRLEAAGQKCINIRFDNVEIRDNGGYVLYCKNSTADPITSVSDISFDKINVIKPSVISNQGVIYLEKVSNIKINGKLTSEQATPYVGRGVMLNDVEGLDIDLDVSKFNNGYFVGNIGTVKNTVFKGKVTDMHTAGMTLKTLENVDFEKVVFKNNGMNGSSANIVSVSGATSLKNVKFRNVHFGKTGGSVNLYITNALLINNVKFEDSDFTEWISNKLQVDVAGVTRLNNRGLNWSSTIPTTDYWNVGEVVYNTNPIPGGYLGWVCVASGTPGTWKGFGLIQP